MKRIIIATILFCFISAPLLAANPHLGREKQIAIHTALDKIEVLQEKENKGVATALEKTNKVLLQNNLKKFKTDLRKATTTQEFMATVDTFKTDVNSIGNN